MVSIEMSSYRAPFGHNTQRGRETTVRQSDRNRPPMLQHRRPKNRETENSLKDEVEKAVRMLKDGKSPGFDNIPAEILNKVTPQW